MSLDVVSRLFDVHKVPFKVIAWVTVVSGAFALAPPTLLARLGLDGLVKTYAPYVGVTFVASGALVLINAFGWLFGGPLPR